MTDHDALLSDIESVIHQHCGSDGSSDEHNDWVNDLANAIVKVAGFDAMASVALRYRDGWIAEGDCWWRGQRCQRMQPAEVEAVRALEGEG